MKTEPRSLIIEWPTAEVVIDFLDANTTVELTLESGKLNIVVQVGEPGESTWNETTFEVPLPEGQESDEVMLPVDAE